MTIADPLAWAPAPLQLPPDLRLTPEQFSQVCAANPEAVLELSAEQRRGFAPLCPDLVVELASPSDQGHRSAAALRRKMARHQANGARLDWLLLPEEQAVEVQAAGGDPTRHAQAQQLEGGPVFPGLKLDLSEIRAG